MVVSNLFTKRAFFFCKSRTWVVKLSLTVTAASLNYPGLVPSTGNALKFADLAGQSVFKAGTETIKDFGQTFYYSFLINVEDVSADGSDYFMTIRI